MGTVPTMTTWATGNVPTASQFNTNIRNGFNWLLVPTPFAILRQSSAQTLTDSTATAITFGTEDVDRDGGHSTSVNPSRYTAQTAGYYLPTGAVAFAANATGRRVSRWSVNGSAENATRIDLPASASSITIVPAAQKPIYLNVGDYLELFGTQTSGGNLDTYSGGEAQSHVTLMWIST